MAATNGSRDDRAGLGGFSPLLDATDSPLPPPPAFGTVLEAPPPPARAAPAPAPSRGRTWLIGALAFAALAGAMGFLLGDVVGEERPAPTHAAAPDARPPAEVAAHPDPTPLPEAPAEVVAAAVTDEGPCPPEMVLVEGGKMFMGTDADAPVLATARPAHQVEVQAYCIDRREVTVDQYRRCSDQGECKRAFRNSEWPGSHGETAYDSLCNESYEDRGEHPINCVTWLQAQRFCEWRGGRLPTEAEWEMAARGSDGRVYPWGDAEPDEAHINGCGAECRTWRAAQGLPDTPALLYEASDGFYGTAPVGSFPAGRAQWGLDDIAGNVFEWTADEYRPYPGAEHAAAAEEDTDERVIRGGAFNSFQPEFADPALRFPQAQSAHTHGIGFRCAAEVRR